MIKSSFQRSIISTIMRALLYFSLLRSTFSLSDIDLSSALDPLTTGFMITGNAANDFFGWSVRPAGDFNKDGYPDIIVGAEKKGSSRGAVYVIYGGEKSSLSNINLATALDPLTTGFMITGEGPADELGYSVNGAGDINKDGYDDIIIGAPAYDSHKGAVFVIYGREKSSTSNIALSTTSLNPLTTGFKIIGNAAYDEFGISISTGDIDKDGYIDIIVGAEKKNNLQGAVYVIYGREKSLITNTDLTTTTLDPLTTGFIITGNAANDFFGYSVSADGDINKDGYNDIVVGAFMKNGDQGATYVIYGGEKSSMSNIPLSTTSLTPLTTGFMIKGSSTNVQFGFSVSIAGDINKDGYDDMIVGAPKKNSNQGTTYVIYGGEKSSMSDINLGTTTLDPLTTGFMITGNAAGDNFGYSVSAAGDINNDGYDDMIVGAYTKSSSKGAAYVIYGGEKSSMPDINLETTTLDPLTTGFMIIGNAASDNFGSSVNTAGDLNNDGVSDIIVGAKGKASSQGAAYVIYGCSSCSPCPTHCDECSSLTVCETCTIPYLLYESQCFNSCPDGTFTSTDHCEDCSSNCKQCTNPTLCTECESGYLLYHDQCFEVCPPATFLSANLCEGCPSHCSSCTSKTSCQACDQEYTLSFSLCILSPDSPVSPSSLKTQEKASQAISSGAKGVGSVVCVGSATFPLTSLVSKTVQNTRYLNLSVTTDLAEIYQTWDTNMISWDVPNAFSSQDEFKSSPPLFARYDLGSPFLSNFWPTLMNIGIGFTVFVVCIVIQKLFEQAKYEGWVYSLLQKLVAGSFNFALTQAYACLDDILFYLVLDIKTNPFDTFFSWSSIISAILFMVVGCGLVFFNFWTVKKYQDVKSQGLAQEDMKVLDDFNERNKYWGAFLFGFPG